MKNFWESGKFKILIALLAIMLGFAIAAVYHGGAASFFSNVAGTITAPFQKMSSSITYSVQEWFQKRTNSQAIYDENKELKEEIRELRGKVIDYNNIKNENEKYVKIKDVIAKNPDWEIQPASVIARDNQNRFYSFTMDKGSIDGVEFLDPVISADGLVGYVSEVGYTYSKVITILDVKADVGVYASTVRDIGVLSGTAELAEQGLCVMEYLPRDSKISEGDFAVTSGSLTSGASIYPRDIMIGKVKKVEPDEHGTDLRAIVEPMTDIATVKDVYVITDFEGQGRN